METRKANIYTDSSAEPLETFSNAPCLHRKWPVAYALDSAAVILASSNGAIPTDVKVFETGSFLILITELGNNGVPDLARPVPVLRAHRLGKLHCEITHLGCGWNA